MEKHMTLLSITVGALIVFVTVHSMQLKWEEELQAASSEGLNAGIKRALDFEDSGIIFTKPNTFGFTKSVYCTEGGKSEVMRLVELRNMTIVTDSDLSSDCKFVFIYSINDDKVGVKNSTLLKR